MKEKHLIGASFLIATAGLMLLFLISAKSNPPLVKISEISYEDVGKKMAVRGEITSKRIHKDGHIFLKVDDGSGELLVVFFSSRLPKIGGSIRCLSEGEEIEVAGEVHDFRGTLEIIPKSGDDLQC